MMCNSQYSRWRFQVLSSMVGLIISSQLRRNCSTLPKLHATVLADTPAAPAICRTAYVIRTKRLSPRHTMRTARNVVTAHLLQVGTVTSVRLLYRYGARLRCVST